jgi:asparagine synthase (glutamine-hydrolysing)
MCGINGFVRNSQTIDKSLISSMNQAITHRGPDDSGDINELHQNKHVAMGMQRLSIIDLETGQQPLNIDNGNLVIVFNGEIYNYKSIKDELISSHQANFETTSDTEVILKAYQIHGTQSFSMLDGMFAFSILDKNKQKIYIVRDFFGEKPLYYTQKNSGVYWASELKSIKKILPEELTLSKKAIELFFQLTYIPSPHSIYEDVYKLRPYHYLDIDLKTLEVLESKIPESKASSFEESLSFDQAKLKTKELVTKSVISRSVSDVPVGTFLSGGVDSSIVSLCLANNTSTPINTFSMGFEKKSFDETDKSKLVAKLLGSHHHEFIVKPKDILENLDEVILNYDEPFADSSALPTYLLSKLTSKEVKVTLTGDGGDEVFGGYNKYYMGKLNQTYTSLIPSSVHDNLKGLLKAITKSKTDHRGKRFKLRKLLEAVNYDGHFYHNIISLGFQNNELSRLFSFSGALKSLEELISVKNPKSLLDFRAIDQQISLEGDMLVKVDRASMLNSIECRSPFLNKELWEFTNSLPDQYLINNWNKKYILKKAFESYFPKGFLSKPKKGFGVPVGDLLKDLLKDELLSYTDKTKLKAQGIFNVDYISQLILNHIDGKEDNTFRVWSFYCFQKWYFETYKL